MVTSTISLMVPGRVAMTTMRSARKIDSEMLWVTKTTVFLSCSQMRSSSSCITSRRYLSLVGLAEHEDKFPGEHARDSHPLLHATREPARELVLVLGEPDQGEIAAGHRAPLGSGQALDHGAELH